MTATLIQCKIKTLQNKSLPEKWVLRYALFNHSYSSIRHFHVDHNASCLTPNILHNHFQFLLDILVIPREIEDSYLKFWGINKVRYSLGENSECQGGKPVFFLGTPQDALEVTVGQVFASWKTLLKLLSMLVWVLVLEGWGVLILTLLSLFSACRCLVELQTLYLALCCLV